MHNLGDDRELDHMSREAAGKYNAPGRPDWQKMEAELDKVLPVEKKRRRFLFWWLLPVLLAGGVTYWLLEKNNEAVAPETYTHTGAAVNTPLQPENIASVPGENTAAIPARSSKQPVQDNAPILLPRNSEPVVQTANDTRINDTREKITVTPLPEKQDATPGNSPKQAESVTKLSTEQATNLAAENPAPVTATTAKTTADNNATVEQPAEEKPNTTVEESPIVSIRKKAAAFRYGKGISVSAIAGIDKSTVKFSYGDQPGVNAGVLAGYHFNDRFSLHTGAIYTQKNYTMAGKDFHAPKGSWASYYKLDEVEGYCRMWEVPLLARYAFSLNGKRNYFASAGLSSYFMTSERYTYYYHHQGQPATRSATYGAGDSHILSVAHLSAGFESNLSRNMRLQIEPYAKLPLAGVGFGSIQLSSFGINFGLQFRQPSKK